MKIVCAAFIVLIPAVLVGCNRDCDCARDVTEPVVTELKVPCLSNIPSVTPLFKAAHKDAVPLVTGSWVGRWESVGHKGHGGTLKCEAVQSGPQKWTATFTAEYGQVKMYDVKLEGKLEDGAVVFGGIVDLGKGDGGNFKWTGKATPAEFTGKYEGGGDTGTFTMTRPQRRGL